MLVIVIIIITPLAAHLACLSVCWVPTEIGIMLSLALDI